MQWQSLLKWGVALIVVPLFVAYQYKGSKVALVISILCYGITLINYRKEQLTHRPQSLDIKIYR